MRLIDYQLLQYVRDRFPEGLQVYKRRKFRGKMGIGSESN